VMRRRDEATGSIGVSVGLMRGRTAAKAAADRRDRSVQSPCSGWPALAEDTAAQFGRVPDADLAHDAGLPAGRR